MFILYVFPERELDAALREHDMTHDEAWRTMGYKSAAQFSKVMSRQRPLDEQKVAALPFKVKASFYARMLKACALDFAEELLGDKLRMAKADLREPVQQKARA